MFTGATGDQGSTGVKDTDLQTLSYVDDEDFDDVCSLNPYSKSLCRDNHLWILKINNTFSDFPIDNNYQNAKELYQRLRIDDIGDIMKYFILNGYLTWAKWLMLKFPDFSSINWDVEKDKFKVFNIEIVEWLITSHLLDNQVIDIIIIQAVLDDDIAIIKYLDSERKLYTDPTIRLAYSNAKLDILKYLDQKYSAKLKDKDMITFIKRSVYFPTNKIRDTIAMLQWLYDKGYHFADEYVVIRLVLDVGFSMGPPDYVWRPDEAKIINVNPRRIIAILDWIYLKTDLVIDYDYIIAIIKSGEYNRPLIKNYDQTEVLEWLEDHKAVDEII